MATRGIRGEAHGREPRSHSSGFDRALEDAVRKFAEENGPTDEPVELSVTFGVMVTVTNPGRIEGYVATLG
jgi:hypothetical protein